MYKKLVTLLIIFMLLFVSIPSIAAEQPVIYKSAITVTEDGGRYQIGFVNIEFKKEFLEADKLPVTFNVEVSAKSGVAGIEVTATTLGLQKFFKKVHIRVDSYKGLLYDISTGENIEVVVKKQQILASHFSRYAFS